MPQFRLCQIPMSSPELELIVALIRTCVAVLVLGIASTDLVAQPPKTPLPTLVVADDGNIQLVRYKAEERVRIVSVRAPNGIVEEVPQSYTVWVPYQVDPRAVSSLEILPVTVTDELIASKKVAWHNFDGTRISAEQLKDRVKSGDVVAVTRGRPMHESLRKLFAKSAVNLVVNPAKTGK